ncbi:YIP1 family protein [Bacteroidota bacterium]
MKVIKIRIFRIDRILPMEIKNLYLRTKNLLIKPISEFDTISVENQSIRQLNRKVVLPYAALVGLCALLGSIFTHINSPLDSFIYVLLNAVIVFLIVLVQTYSAGQLVALLGKNINISNQKEAVYGLVVYAQIPFYLVLAFTEMFPSLIFLIFLAAYSAYLIYVGIDGLLKISSVRKMQFLILSLIIMVVLYILVDELLSLLYSEILDLFSTFAVL